jgi:hypothetical protein
MHNAIRPYSLRNFHILSSGLCVILYVIQVVWKYHV